MTWEIVKSVLSFGETLSGLLGNRRRLRVLIHRARFVGGGPDCYFVNVTNLSEKREVVITHVWFETDPPVDVMQPTSPLPKRLRSDETWETWIPVEKLPITSDEQVFKLGRVRMSNDAVVKSKKRRYVPSAGFFQRENERLGQENLELKKKVELQEELQYRARLYWRDEDVVPYCPYCYEKSRLPIHLDGPEATSQGEEFNSCEECGRTYRAGPDTDFEFRVHYPRLDTHTD